MSLEMQRKAKGLYQITVRVENRTPFSDESASRESALPWALLACHVQLNVEGASFVSSIDPPEDLRTQVQACRSIGVWPVLVGEVGRTDALLAAPIILPDYPQVAEESPGDLFDATEIDELLNLRILTLSEEEKRQLVQAPSAVRSLLGRTESLTDTQLLQLHGRQQAWESLRVGQRVCLRPRGRSDIFDMALAGMTAVVVKVEQDLEGQVYVRVAVEDDPGRDLGHDGRPGHCFFFRADEVESLADE